MLKISLIDSAKQRRLVVEGTLIAPWAAELSSASDKAKADLQQGWSKSRRFCRTNGN